MAILGHRVVGGFLSYCGWNSILEAVVTGVWILGWPMEADHFVIAKLLVEDLGVAVRVCEGEDLIPDPDETLKETGVSSKTIANRSKAPKKNSEHPSFATLSAPFAVGNRQYLPEPQTEEVRQIYAS
ncbi:hypothetical protein KIW84_022751 [Lathyrus oleraceus]|uniref:Uncharacterized protein n=1 Tax=Pisum sativum TaxID=3888 RepID=A0A9D5B713_PEA|nr:hypothetical protein KIW84_022751 [Pisum sativum]